jgi:hypothetical protein
MAQYRDENAFKWPDCTAERGAKIIARLKPRVFYVCPQIIFDTDYIKSFCSVENSKMQAISPQNVFSMFHSIKMADMARREWMEDYDCVIRCRTDLKFTRPIESRHFEDLSKIYIPEEGCWGGQNDFFAFSSGDNMHKYSKCFDYLESHMKGGGIFHPETILNHHLKVQGVPVENIETYYELVR